MPVDFIGNVQQERYGRYAGAPSREQLTRYFHLDDRDRTLVGRLRGERNRLGFAVQLGTVRFLGTFISKPSDVPPAVTRFMARQLAVQRVDELDRYGLDSTVWRHAQHIKNLYGYRDFTDPTEGWRLVRWLYARAWTNDEPPSVLFDGATARLVERKVLLPGATTLARLVARVKRRADERLWSRLAGMLPKEQLEGLEALLVVPSGGHKSTFDRLRRGPDRVSGPALVGALRRAAEFESLNSTTTNLWSIPPNRLKALAKYAFAAHAPMLAQMSQLRRAATLLAFSLDGRISAMDDAIDVLDVLITDFKASAETEAERARLAASADLSAAALCMRQACQPLLDASVPDGGIRSAAFARVSRTELEAAMEQTARLARSPAEAFHEQFLAQHARVRRFLPALLHGVRFHSTPGGEPVLEALAFLRSIEGRYKPEMTNAPRAVVTRPWRRWVFPESGTADRRAYTLCVLEQLQDKLHSRDIFLSSSERWGDPRLKLLQGEAWNVLRPHVCRSLDHRESGQEEVARLTTWLDQAYRRTLETLPTQDDWRIERKKDRDRLVVSALDKLGEPESLVKLKESVGDLLPHVDLPEALLEIQARTGFAEAFTHLSEPQAWAKDLGTSVCAVLTAEACNIPLEPIVRPEISALTRRRLRWIQQNYIRPDTIARANARLVDFQAQMPLAQLWGGGEVASADGLRFRTPVRTVYAGPNPKYFGTGRGVTYINFMSDQFTGFHGIVVPGTLRDSLFILEGLLEQQTSLKPQELMTDTAGASEIIFGLFWLLGYQFSPRLADIGGARFWRIDRKADYGILNGLSRHRINTRKIIEHWDDLLRVAGSLKMGTVRASELLRSLFRTNRRSSLTCALAELGRIPKTVHHLTYISDEDYRRRTLTHLNHGESRHSVAREVFHGRRGELRQKYRQGQEEQLGALGLVVNALVLWNTIYTQASLDHLRHRGVPINEEDVARLSPLSYDNFNFLGRYSFELPPRVAKGGLRSLRDSESLDE